MEEEQKKLHVDATMENLDAVIGFVEEQLQEAACPGKVCGQICVSVEEIYVNIVNYAYGGRVGPCAITTSIECPDPLWSGKSSHPASNLICRVGRFA